jgi:exodeoxyribonuclease-3
LGLVSVYHEQSGEEHGKESHNTYRHRSSASKPFHLDYCFVSGGLAAAATVCILGPAEWCKRSDHSPVVLDIPDGAFH